MRKLFPLPVSLRRLVNEITFYSPAEVSDNSFIGNVLAGLCLDGRAFRKLFTVLYISARGVDRLWQVFLKAVRRALTLNIGSVPFCF
jgi:hypothetical protein